MRACSVTSLAAAAKLVKFTESRQRSRSRVPRVHRH
jgi:hypothetical protein